MIAVNLRAVVAVHHRMPRRMHQSGFTLLEIVVAFAVLALGLGLAMRIAGGAVEQARNGQSFSEAALYAKSRLDMAGAGERLEEGMDSGEFDDRYRWELEVQPFEAADAGTDAGVTGVPPVELYRLVLTVFWRDGEHERRAEFSTLRALTPDPQR